MRLVFLFFICLLGSVPYVLAQETVLYFSWDTSVTDPDTGPDGLVATTDSPYVKIDAGGANGTNGLSAGLRAGGDAGVTNDKANIHLIVPSHEAFNVEGVDISIDYQRDEALGTLVSRGADFVFGTAEGAQVTYRLWDPAEGNVTTFSSPTELLDLDDNLFHALRFVYDPNTGQASLSVDGTVVWEPGVTTPGQVLYWDETADILIGFDIDGAGSDRPVMDNFSFGSIPLEALPVELKAFTVLPAAQGIQLHWETVSEVDHQSFRVQRLAANGEWKNLHQLPGAGYRPAGNSYAYLDRKPHSGLNYYRLAQVDFSGAISHSPVRSIRFNEMNGDTFAAYPNPTGGLLTLSGYHPSDLIRVSDLRGRDRTSAVVVSCHSPTTYQVDLRSLPVGYYIIHTPTGSRKILKR